MEPHTVGFMCISFLILLLLSGMRIGFALLFSGIVGIALMKGIWSSLSSVAVILITQSQSYLLIMIPCFLFMASILTESGLVSELFSAIEKWIGRLPGGLAIATIIAGTAFGAVSGSTLAAAAAFAKAATPAMRKYGYDDVLSVGSVAAASNMSFLIPPSIFFVIYGIIVEMSIGKLFIAGILPGLLLMLLLIGVVLLYALKTKGSVLLHLSYTWKERLLGLKVIGVIGVIAFVVLGSIYLGVCTPTESAALGSLGSLVAFILLKKANWDSFTKSVNETLKTTGMLFILLIGAQVFSSMLTVSEIPLWIMENLAHGKASPVMFLLLVIHLKYYLFTKEQGLFPKQEIPSPQMRFQRLKFFRLMKFVHVLIRV